MNWIEFAIARCAGALEQKDPGLLTKQERWLLEELTPSVRNYRQREELLTAAKAERAMAAGAARSPLSG
jgi:hypothetical protein